MNSTIPETLSSPKKQFSADILNFKPGQLIASTPIDEAITQIVMVQLQLILTYEPIAVEGSDPEGVHKLRVGLRRLRTALKLFKPYIQPEVLTYLKTNSKQIARQLGGMRDFDVLKIHYFNYFQKKEIELPYEADWHNLFQANYNQTREKTVSLIQSSTFSDLIYQTYKLHQSPETCLLPKSSISTLPYTLIEFIPPKISKYFAKIQTYKDTLTPQVEYDRYHALRLEIKKFRYMLEFFPDLLNSNAAQKIIDMLVQIQDHLGELNDSVTANNFMTTLKEKGWTDSLQHYHLHRQEEYKQLLTDFKPLWEQFNQQSNIKKIQRNLASRPT